VEALEIFGLKSLSEPEPAPEDIVALADARVEARERKDFAEADRLRAEIEASGWDVRDEAGSFRLVRRR
jgi:cysteinyl-tRNA synthetase